MHPLNFLSNSVLDLDPDPVIFICSALSLSLTLLSSLYHCPSSPGVAQIEESASQRLLDMEEEKKHREHELESLEEQLRQCTAKSQITDSELQYPLYVCVCCGKCNEFSPNLALCTVFCVSILNPPPDFCRESWSV